MKRTIFPVIFILLSLCAFTGHRAVAQDSQQFTHTIDSKAFDGERQVRVFLPERYARDSTGKFIVTYVLDAQSDAVWNMACGTIGYMVHSYAVIPMIVVGIVTDNRRTEFDPYEPALGRHLREEVFPLIAGNYRVKDFRAVIGHSRGGAFVGGTLFGADRDLFDAYIGISPGLDAEDDIIYARADSILRMGKPLGKFFYCSAGDIGLREIESADCIRRMDSLLDSHPQSGVAWRHTTLPGTDHWSVVIPSVSDGLLQMSRNYFADQHVMERLARNRHMDLRKQVEAYTAQARSKYGYAHEPSAGYLAFAGNDFRDVEDYASAMSLYNWAVEKEPDNLRVWINLADTHDKMKQAEQAKPAFERVLELLEAQKDEHRESWRNAIEKWAREKLASYE